MKKKLLILTGAGISKESGVDTFRCADGFWSKQNPVEMLTYQNWKVNKQEMLNFHKILYDQVSVAEPNLAHTNLTKLEDLYDVQIITQNVDDLHEKAGSKNILHVHGEIKKSRSTNDPNLIYDVTDIDYIKLGDKCEKGSQLRPNVIWFGENIYGLTKLYDAFDDCDIMVIIGTSLHVYPFAYCLNFVYKKDKVYLIDPNEVSGTENYSNIIHIKKTATEGTEELLNLLSY